MAVIDESDCAVEVGYDVFTSGVYTGTEAGAPASAVWMNNSGNGNAKTTHLKLQRKH